MNIPPGRRNKLARVARVREISRDVKLARPMTRKKARLINNDGGGLRFLVALNLRLVLSPSLSFSPCRSPMANTPRAFQRCIERRVKRGRVIALN
jgi:hypothetical protein